MKRRTLVLRSLAYYWRTNIAVVLGVATAVAVLGGALLVGDSVRGSLRDLVLQRLGKTNHVVLSTGFFRESLATDIPGAPIVIARGSMTVQGGPGRAGNVTVYGVDERFWAFHGVMVEPLSGRDALVSSALAKELGQAAGATVLVHLQKPSDIPLESLHGRKTDAGSTIRSTIRAIQPREAQGEFSLQAQQGAVRAVFLPLDLLQRELGLGSRVNALLVSGDSDVLALQQLVRTHATLEDLGLQIYALDANRTALDSRSGVLDDVIGKAAVDTASAANIPAEGLLTYLANSMRVGSREVPYSLVTAIEMPEVPPSTPSPIVLNEWAARELQAQPGDTLSMDYLLWEEPGQLTTRSTEFRVAAIVPIERGDRRMAPEYPGISDATSLVDWDPPFPLDLRKIRPVDEDYWDKYTTTPKAFVPLQVGQQLWKSRYGALTSIRFTSGSQGAGKFETDLRAKIDPLAAGLSVINVREQGLEASRGATNFGEYFVYFSFFLVVSALLLAALFFKLSVEQRIREVGLLRAVGLPHSMLQRIFLTEGLVLSVAGALLGTAGAILYAGAIVSALRTWWVDAVGTSDIVLHVSRLSLGAGAAGGVFAALFCIAVTLRGLRHRSERSLLGGEIESTARGPSRPIAPLVLGLTGIVLLLGGTAGLINPDGAFFGGGFGLLAAALLFYRFRLSRPARTPVRGQGWQPMAKLGFRNASYRPARSVVAMATIASAAFILVSVDAFRKDASSTAGTGGYALIVETLAPLVHDPNSLAGLTDFRFEPFRLRPGDDTSCLNLYEPKNPRILAPRDSFITAKRFVFQNSQAATDAQRDNPWLLLHQTFDDGAIPVIADANSMTYVLHRKLGEDFVITSGNRDIRLRFVAALSDSIFQSELLMSEANFLKLFPEQEGYSLLLAENAPESAAAQIEDALLEYNADATTTSARLAEFHRVENTYLSTFQMLGGLGLLLGTVGLAAVLLRSILERRRELALLRTLGYEQKHFFIMTVGENATLLLGGLLTGVLCALIAVAPAWIERGGQLPALTLLPVLGGVFAVGLLISILATAAALRGAVLSSLRSE
jgi:putative ABC transport system permease protein